MKSNINTIKHNSFSWLKPISTILALMPVLILGLIILFLITNSFQAITMVGVKNLFSTHFSGVFTTGQSLYGLIPALWGTFLTVLVSIFLAFPVSLCLAIVSSDSSFGFLCVGVRAIIGVLSGIPPVVYALMSSVLASLFIIPKFCGAGIPVEQLPPPGLTWWTTSMLPYDKSTLLGSILLACLIIPFITPLMDDAIKNVPNSLKEASLALGANRWQTLQSVTIPAALSGISAATTLGTLKAMGDVIIVAWVVGYESGLPSPLIDLLEKTAPLTSTAAGLAGGFTRSSVFSPEKVSVANFSGLLLLIIAFGILGLSAFLQKQFRKRYGA